MTNKSQSDETEERGSVSVTAADQEASQAKKQANLYSKGRIELGEADLASRVASRFMIDHIERLEAENSQLHQYRTRYYEQTSELAALRSRASLSDVSKNISSLMLSVGSAGAGIIGSFFSISRISVILFVVFVAIAIGSFFIKVRDNA